MRIDKPGAGSARKFGDIILIVLACLIVIAVAITALYPLRQSLFIKSKAWRDQIISTLETRLERQIVYDSMHPAFFQKFDIRGVKIFRPDGSIQLSVDRLQINYSLTKLLKDDLLTAIRSVDLLNPYIEFKPKIDLAWLKALLGTGAEVEPKLPSFPINLSQGQIVYYDDLFKVELNRCQLSLVSRADRIALSGNSQLTVQVNDSFGQLNTKLSFDGEIASDFSDANVRLGLNHLENQWVKLQQLTILASYQDSKLEIRKIKDRLPFDFHATYLISQTNWELTFKSERFKPSSVLSLPLAKDKFTAWLEAVYSGSIMASGQSFKPKTYAIDLSVNVPASFPFGGSTIALNCSGDPDRLEIKSASIKSLAGDVLCHGQLGLSPLTFDGLISLKAVRLDQTMDLSWLLPSDFILPQFLIKSLVYQGNFQLESLQGSGLLSLDGLQIYDSVGRNWGPVQFITIPGLSLKQLEFNGAWNLSEVKTQGQLSLAGLKIDRKINLEMFSGDRLEISALNCAGLKYSEPIGTASEFMALTYSKYLDLQLDKLHIREISKFIPNTGSIISLPPFSLASLSFYGAVSDGQLLADSQLYLEGLRVDKPTQLSLGSGLDLDLPRLSIGAVSFSGKLSNQPLSVNGSLKIIKAQIKQAGALYNNSGLHVALAPLSLTSLSFNGAVSDGQLLADSQLSLEGLKIDKPARLSWGSELDLNLPALSISDFSFQCLVDKARYRYHLAVSKVLLKNDTSILLPNEVSLDIAPLQLLKIKLACSLDDSQTTGNTRYTIDSLLIDELAFTNSSLLSLSEKQFISISPFSLARFRFAGQFSLYPAFMTATLTAQSLQIQHFNAWLPSEYTDGLLITYKLPPIQLETLSFGGELNFNPLVAKGKLNLEKLNLNTSLFAQKHEAFQVKLPAISLSTLNWEGSIGRSAFGNIASLKITDLFSHDKSDISFKNTNSIFIPALRITELGLNGFQSLKEARSLVIDYAYIKDATSDSTIIFTNDSAKPIVLPKIGFEAFEFSGDIGFLPFKIQGQSSLQQVTVDNSKNRHSLELDCLEYIGSLSLDQTQLEGKLKVNNLTVNQKIDLAFGSVNPLELPAMHLTSCQFSGQSRLLPFQVDGTFQLSDFSVFQEKNLSFGDLTIKNLPAINLEMLAFYGQVTSLKPAGNGRVAITNFSITDEFTLSINHHNQIIPAASLVEFSSDGSFCLNPLIAEGSLTVNQLMVAATNSNQNSPSFIDFPELSVDSLNFTGQVDANDSIHISNFVLSALRLGRFNDRSGSFSLGALSLPNIILDKACLQGSLNFVDWLSQAEIDLSGLQLGNSNNVEPYFRLGPTWYPVVNAASVKYNGQIAISTLITQGHLGIANLSLGQSTADALVNNPRPALLAASEIQLTGHFDIMRLVGSGSLSVEQFNFRPGLSDPTKVYPLNIQLPNIDLDYALYQGKIAANTTFSVDQLEIGGLAVWASPDQAVFNLDSNLLPNISLKQASFNGRLSYGPTLSGEGQLQASQLDIGGSALNYPFYVIDEKTYPRIVLAHTSLTGGYSDHSQLGSIEWQLGSMAIGQSANFNARLYFEIADEEANLYCDELETAGYIISAIDARLSLKNPEVLSYGLSAVRFRENPSGESPLMTKYALDGELSIRNPYIQTTVNLESFSVGDALIGLRSFYPKLLEGIILPNFLDNIVLTTELYVNSDFQKLSFNAPSLVMAYLGDLDGFMVASLYGTEDHLDCRDLTINIAGETIEGLLSLGYKEPQDISFTVSAAYKGENYSFEGYLLDGRYLAAQGDYGLSFHLSLLDQGIVLGAITAKSFPLPIETYRVIASADLSVVWEGFEKWNCIFSDLEVEEISGKFPRPYKLNTEGYIDQSGMVLSQLVYEDGIGELSGNANLSWETGFSQLRGVVNLSDVFGVERLKLEAQSVDGTINFSGELVEVKFSRLMAQHYDAEVTGSFEGRWRTFEDFQIIIELQDSFARFNNENLTIKGNFEIDQHYLDIDAARLTFINYSFDVPYMTVNLRDSYATLSTRFRGPFAGHDLSSTIDLRAEFSPVTNWFNLIKAADSFTGQAYMTKTRLGALTIDAFPLVFEKDHENLSFHGGPKDAFIYTGRTDGSFVFSILPPLALSGTVSGKITDGQIDATTDSVYLDFPSLWRFLEIPEISFTGGSAVGSLKISGPISDPEFFGEAQASDFRALIPQWLNEEVGPVKAVLSFEGRDFKFGPVTIPHKGQSSLAGSFRFDRWIPIDFVLEANIDENQPLKAKAMVSGVGLEGDASGIMRIRFQSAVLRITGDLKLENTLVTLDAAEIAAARTAYSPVDWATDVNLRLTTLRKVEVVWPTADFPIIRAFADFGNDMWIRYNSLNGRYSIFGDIALRSGDIYYFQRNFYLREGMLRFNENELRFDPEVSIRAELRERAETGPISIWLQIDRAALSQFIPRLESDPPLPQVDILTLLGQNVSGFDEASGSNLQSSVISASSDILAQFSVIRRFEGQVRDLLNFDMFSIRTQLIQNALFSVTGLQVIDDSQMSGFGNYFDKTTVYMGKYVGSNLFLQAMIALQYDERESFNAFGGLKLEWDVGVELKTPFFLLRWNFLPVHPEHLFIDDHSFTLTWRRSL